MQPGLDPNSPLAQLEQRSHELRERAEQLQRELKELEASVTSADRVLTVTVGAGGVLRGVQMESSGLRATPTQWTDALMRAYGQACRVVGEHAATLVEQHTPGSPAAAMMREALPPELPEDERGERR